MKKKFLPGIAIMLILVFLIYFFSESLLREAAVAGISPDSVNIDTVMKELPQGVREAIDYKVQVGHLKDEVRSASSDSDKATSLCNLAFIIKDSEEKEKIYSKVVRIYPEHKEAARAFVFFFCNPDAKEEKVDRIRMHKYIKRFELIDQYYIWTLAFSKMVKTAAPEEDKLNFLMPLLGLKPEYRDFAHLYDKLAFSASKLNRMEVYAKAREAEEKALDYPYIESVLNKKLFDDINQKKR